MPISYEQACELRDDLEPEYQKRHQEHASLRDFWHGRYWDRVDSQTRGVSSIFRDISSAKGDIGPDLKLTRNLIFDVCVKYQTYLSSLPMIRTFIDEPYSQRKRKQATLKERVLYATWAQAEMNRSLNQIAWFGPLMGDCFHGIWPDFENNSVRSIVRSPEYAFPVTSFDGSTMDAVIFSWKVPVKKAQRAFPNYAVPVTKRSRARGEREATCEIVEYSDQHQFSRWVDGQLVNGVEHKLGFNLFEQVPFIFVPGEPWNHGAVEQSVNLVDAGNMLYSLMMQAMLENVFPKLVLEDPMKFGETLDTGPGAVIPVNQGGKAYYLSTPNNAVGAGMAMLQGNEAAIKQDTSMPDVNFGQFNASVITGKAINELQGAGTGSLVEMVQGFGIGSQLVKWNEKALTIYQRMFAEDRVYLNGLRPESITDINPRQFAVSFKGKDLVGSPRNEVVFSPYIGMHEKLVISLQAQGAGLTSKKYGRDQIGIPDSDAMAEEIFAESIDDAVLAGIVQQMTEPTPEGADTAVNAAASYLDPLAQIAAAHGAPPPPHPGLAVGPGAGAAPQAPPGGAPGGGMPIGPLGTGGGQVAAPAIKLPPGSPAPAGSEAAPPGAPPPSAAPSGGVTVQDALSAFSSVQLAGKAWLVGEIAATGSTQDAVEVAVTDPSDKQALQAAASFPTIFHTVTGEPDEQSVPIGGQ